MYFLHLPLLYFILNLFGTDPALEYSSSSAAKAAESITVDSVKTNGLAENLILQSKDGGQTWQDISATLPENGQLHGFFAGETDIYLRVHDVMYRSSSHLKTPIWEKQSLPDHENTSIAFNPSGVMAYHFEGQVYRKKPSSETWLPLYVKSKNRLETVFEAANGDVFLGTQSGLYKSTDKGQNWKQVLNEGWVSGIVESQGVLLGTGQKGIMRSTDNGEHWEWVISEGGVGIAVERIDGGFAAISFDARSQTRRIRISKDGGKNWKAIDQSLPPSMSITSIKQMGPYLLCGHPNGIFRSADMGRTWNVVHASLNKTEFRLVSVLNPAPSDAGKKVFRLFASGNMLYAVLNNSGC